MGLLEKVNILKNKTTHGMGLLQRSLLRIEEEIQENRIPAVGIEFTATTNAEKESVEERSGPLEEEERVVQITSERVETPSEHILEELNKLEKGVESPAELFRIIQKYIQFEKGVLLLLVGESRMWMPCSSKGLEDHSLELLKIPFNDALPFFAEKSTVLCRITDKNALNDFKNLFSETDFNESENLILKPFYYRDSPAALFIIMNLEERHIVRLNEVLQSVAAEQINARYEIYSELENSEPENQASLEDQIKSALEKGRKPALFRIAFDSVLKSISAENEYSNPEWLRQDLLPIVNHIYHKAGATFECEDDSILFLTDNSEQLDSALIAHQSSVSLRKYIKKANISLDIQPQDLPLNLPLKDDNKTSN